MNFHVHIYLPDHKRNGFLLQFSNLEENSGYFFLDRILVNTISQKTAFLNH